MNEIIDKKIICPYCGETIAVLIDTSVPQQNYIEDCQVCCRPIIFDVIISPDGDADVRVTHEND
ncbi:MAG: CPXCG motif-containing cysteine-rich protein [Thiohalomonadales bacterium]